jgi:hypothetical protein
MEVKEMANKYFSDTQEKIEHLKYTPEIRDTADLESATKTITAVSEPGTADYSQALTLPCPDDSRIIVKRIAARLQVVIDSLNGAAQLNCRVYLDQKDTDHLLFDKAWTTAGDKLEGQTTYSGVKAVIFNLLKDGAAHSFYFHCWVNSGNAVISVVRLWEGVGLYNASGPGEDVLEVRHTGLIMPLIDMRRIGTGSFYFRLFSPPDTSSYATMVDEAPLRNDPYTYGNRSKLIMSSTAIVVRPVDAGVTTDLCYLHCIGMLSRSEQ